MPKKRIIKIECWIKGQWQPSGLVIMEGSTKGNGGVNTLIGCRFFFLVLLYFFPSCFVILFFHSFSSFTWKDLITMKNVEALSVTDSSGRQVSLLNNEATTTTTTTTPDHHHLQKRTTPTTPHVVQHNVTGPSPLITKTHQPVMYNQTLPTSPIPTQPAMNTTQWTSYRQQRSAPSGNNESNTSRRKYHCTEPGCNKSFTTR